MIIKDEGMVLHGFVQNVVDINPENWVRPTFPEDFIVSHNERMLEHNVLLSDVKETTLPEPLIFDKRKILQSCWNLLQSHPVTTTTQSTVYSLFGARSQRLQRLHSNCEKPH